MNPTYNENIVDAILIVLKLAERPITAVELANRIKAMIETANNPQIKAHLKPLIEANFIKLTSDLKLCYID